MSGWAAVIVPSVSGSRALNTVFRAQLRLTWLGPRIVGMTLASTSSSSLARLLLSRNALNAPSENLEGESDGLGLDTAAVISIKSGSFEVNN